MMLPTFKLILKDLLELHTKVDNFDANLQWKMIFQTILPKDSS